LTGHTAAEGFNAANAVNGPDRQFWILLGSVNLRVENLYGESKHGTQLKNGSHLKDGKRIFLKLDTEFLQTGHKKEPVWVIGFAIQEILGRAFQIYTSCIVGSVLLCIGYCIDTHRVPLSYCYT